MSVEEIKAIIDSAPLEEQLLLSAYLHRKFSTDSAIPLADQLTDARKRMDVGHFVTLEKAIELHQKLESWGF